MVHSPPSVSTIRFSFGMRLCTVCSLSAARPNVIGLVSSVPGAKFTQSLIALPQTTCGSRYVPPTTRRSSKMHPARGYPFRGLNAPSLHRHVCATLNSQLSVVAVTVRASV